MTKTNFHIAVCCTVQRGTCPVSIQPLQLILAMKCLVSTAIAVGLHSSQFAAIIEAGVRTTWS